MFALIFHTNDILVIVFLIAILFSYLFHQNLKYYRKRREELLRQKERIEVVARFRKYLLCQVHKCILEDVKNGKPGFDGLYNTPRTGPFSVFDRLPSFNEMVESEKPLTIENWLSNEDIVLLKLN